jgi:hypothetical protein
VVIDHGRAVVVAAPQRFGVFVVEAGLFGEVDHILLRKGRIEGIPMQLLVGMKCGGIGVYKLTAWPWEGPLEGVSLELLIHLNKFDLIIIN